MYERSDELREVEELTGEGAVVTNQCQNEGTVVTMYDLKIKITVIIYKPDYSNPVFKWKICVRLSNGSVFE